MTKWIVELEAGTQWLALWPGDPGRTCVRETARKYRTISAATYGLAHARKYRQYLEAKIVEVSDV